MSGHQGVQGLQCYTCTAESKEKCHYARSGDGTGDKNSWFGDLTTCSDSEDHCMTARTRTLFFKTLCLIFYVRAMLL